MNKYLPSKKFLYTLFSIVLALAIIWGVTSLPKKQKEIVTAVATQTSIAEKFKLLDSDGDGVKDWEEALWKTDSKKADTDGDGTNDGEEIKANRDPLKANTALKNQEPNDKVDEKIIAADKKTDEEFAKLNNTDKFGRDLFSTYLATKKIDSAMTDSEKLGIANSVIDNLPPITFKVYGENEIVVSPNINSADLTNYSNNLAEIILINLRTRTEIIDDIITDFSNTEDSAQAAAALERLDPIVQKNKLTVDKLLKLSIPKNLVTEHLLILNAFEEIYESLKIMAGAGSDMIALMPPLNHYDLSVQALADSLNKTRSQLINLKVTFASQTDFGYQLFNVIMLKN